MPKKVKKALKRYRPWYVNVDRRLLENSVGWGDSHREAKVAVLLDMLSVLCNSALPIKVAHKFANDYRSLPSALQAIERSSEADVVKEALKNLASRRKRKPLVRN